MTAEERDNAIRYVKEWSEEAPYLQTYKTCLEALEKQIPKMVNYIADRYINETLVYDMAECPNCGNDDFEYGIGNWGCKFCPECGQALEWEEDK